MAKPFIGTGKSFKKMEGDVVASTVAVCSDQGGWNSVHAEWLRKPGKSALVREFMDKQMAEEAYSLWVARSQVKSDCGYPEGWQLKPLDVQAAILAEYFPGLDVSRVHELAGRYIKDGRLDLPEGMDGLVVIPKPEAIVRSMGCRIGSGEYELWPAYNRAMRHVLDVLAQAIPGFHDATHGQVNKRRLSPDEKTVKLYDELFALPGDVMVLAVQTGILHRGKSPEYVAEFLQSDECGLDSLAVACILLTHPERLMSGEDLAIDCLGAVLYPENHTCGVPSWTFYEGGIQFYLHDLDHASPSHGSATARRPK